MRDKKAEGGVMKRSLFIYGCLAILLLGCSFFTSASQDGTTQPGAAEGAEATVAAGEIPEPTEKPGETPAPTMKAALPAATNTTCNELSFFLNSRLAKSAKCETIPASSGAMPFDTYPMYTKVTLSGYPIAGRMMLPVISVYSVEKFTELLPEVVSADISTVQTVIAGGSADGDLPILPVQNANQLFVAQFALLPFQNGSGIGYVTQYAQAYVPINNNDMFFSFQGLTSDGKYWVSVILPISHPSLWENRGDPSNTIYTTINDNPESYYAQMSAEINSKGPRTFIPMLTLLTDLVNSILITAT
jgi:hypothetical protein